MTMPTLEELPRLTGKNSRHTYDLMNLALIPVDDAQLRAAVLAYFKRAEDELNDIITDKSRSHVDDLRDLAGTVALTPGGIAWKLATAVSFWKDDSEPLEWWQFMVQDALSDVIELERARRSAVSASTQDIAVVLVDRWADLQRRHDMLPEPEGDEQREQLCQEWISIARMLCEIPATSVDGIVAKLRLLKSQIEAGSWADNHDQKLCDSIAEDVRRICGSRQEPAR